MRIDIISLFPDFVRCVADYGVTGRAITNGLLQLEYWNPRDYTIDQHRSVDDRPYGGGPGMVLKPEPLCACIQAARKASADGAQVIYLSPQGQRLTQAALHEYKQRSGLILLAGRYEGIDERVIETEVDEQWSLGDYILSGGELAAMVIVDALARLLPGALGDAASAEQESFADGLLEHPQYTRPEEFAGQHVPSILLSGDHQQINRWRRQQALGRTWERRPELLDNLELDAEQQALLNAYRQTKN